MEGWGFINPKTGHKMLNRDIRRGKGGAQLQYADDSVVKLLREQNAALQAKHDEQIKLLQEQLQTLLGEVQKANAKGAKSKDG